MTKMIWPDFFPDGCPPEEAGHMDTNVFRLCKNNPPMPEDFSPYKILFPNKTFPGKECQSCGVSVYNNLDDIKSLKKLHKGLRKNYVFSGNITQGTGYAMPTPNNGDSHITWWIAKDHNPEGLFKVLVGG